MAESSLSQDQRGLPSLMSSLNRTMECPICFEDNKNLRVLSCCEKLICLPCLEKYFEDATSMSKDGPDCPLCTRTLTKKPQEYTVSKVVQHFQAYAKSLNRAVKRDEDKSCESPDCRRPFDKWCKKCKKILCYRCSLELCAADGADHDATDILDCIAQSKEDFNIWKTAKEKAIQNCAQQVEEASALIREYAQQLASTSNDSLAHVTRETIPLLTAAHENLVELQETRQKEELELSFQVEAERNARGVKLIMLIEQLKIYEEQREILIGDHETLVDGVPCCDVCNDSSGNILVAKVGGLDVMDPDGKHLLKSLEFQIYVFTIATHQEIIICGVRLSASQKEIVTLDKDYHEINRWAIPEEVTDFTAVDGKIFLSSQNAVESNICAYSLAGERLSSSDVLWNGHAAAIDSMLPCSLVLCDVQENKIYKQCVTSGKRQTDWSADVQDPECLYVDSTGLIWVHSNPFNCLTILNRDGSKHQEDIVSDKLRAFGEVVDLLVYNGFLYIAHSNGVVRFLIKYK